MTDANGKNDGPAPHDAGGDELAHVKRLVREYGQPIVIGVAAAALIYLGYNYWMQRKTSARVDAARMLEAAGTPEQLLAVAKNYPSAPSAAAALLAVAGDQYQAGHYDPARTHYEDFLKRFPDHPLRGAAEVNRLLCLEGATRYEEAIRGYEAFAAANPDHFMTPTAVFGKARGLEAQGRFDEARAVYEDFMAAQPESPWRAQAEEGLSHANQRQRAASAPAATPGVKPEATMTPPPTPMPAAEAPAP